MAAETGMVFWAFEHYLKNNPHKAAGGLTNDDITAMADLFYSYNSNAVARVRPDVGSDFTNIDWPDFTDVEDEGGVDAIRDTATIDQARYPESHRGSKGDKLW